MPGVQVTVRLSGALAERLGPRLVVELGPGARVRDLLDALAHDRDLGERATDALVVVSQGAIVPPDHALADGDRVDVLAPVAGG